MTGEELDALDRSAAEKLGWQDIGGRWVMPLAELEAFDLDGAWHSDGFYSTRTDEWSPTRNPAQAMALLEQMPCPQLIHADHKEGWWCDPDVLSDETIEEPGDTPCIAITRAFVAHAASVDA